MLQTKLCVPRISKNIVSRKAVQEKLMQLSEYKLAFVSAPAGYGKTTAVVDYLEHSSIRYAWFSIDNGDNDPVRFWNYIKTSISSCLNTDEMFSGIVVNPELVLSNIATDLLLNVLNDISESITIVLDDYHLIENELILRSIEHFVKYMPQKISMIILSRKEPDYELSRLFSRETAVRLGIKELAFSSAETTELFAQRGIELSSNEISALEKSTEGWAAALIAASLSIKESGNTAESIRSFSGKNYSIYETLENEVFSKWPEKSKEFLVHTAFLDKLTGSLCAEVTGKSESSELLKALADTNSFIIPLDQDRTWFRYHHLFQEFLLGKLEAESDLVRHTLFGNAGRWYEKNGHMQDSINNYLKAEEFESAFPLVWDIYLELTQNGEYSLWRRWIESMPEELIESDVRICTGYSWILSIENQIEKAQVWAEKARACYELIKDILDKTDRDFLEANITLVDANVAVFRMDADEALSCYRRVYELAVLTPVIVGEMNPGEPSLLETAYGFKGRLNMVSRGYESVVEDAPRVLGDFSAYLSAVLAECYYERNNLKEVYSTLVKSMGRITGLRNPGVIVPSFITLAKLKRAQGDVEGALRVIESGRTILGSSNTLWSYFFDIFTADLYINKGDSENAAKRLATYIGVFDTLSVSREFEYIVFTKYLILKKSYDEALILLGRLEDFTKREDRLGSEIEVLCLKAICAERLGEANTSMSSLHEALKLGYPDVYVRTFVDLNQPMVELLIKYKSWVKETCDNKYLEYSQSLLKLTKENIKVQKAADIRSKALNPIESQVKDILTDRETVVLKLMTEELSNQEIAEKLFITVRTVKYYNTRIFDKLGVNNRLEAVIKAREIGLHN